jgi:hypothetical protein
MRDGLRSGGSALTRAVWDTGHAQTMNSGTKLLVGFTLGVMVVVGAIVSLATGSWWFLILAVGIHVIATAILMGTIGSRLRQQDKPDPVTEARLLEERDDPHLAT